MGIYCRIHPKSYTWTKGIFISIGWPATTGNVCSVEEADENWQGRTGRLIEEDTEVAGFKDVLTESSGVSSNLSPNEEAELLEIVVTLKDSIKININITECM